MPFPPPSRRLLPSPSSAIASAPPLCSVGGQQGGFPFLDAGRKKGVPFLCPPPPHPGLLGILHWRGGGIPAFCKRAREASLPLFFNCCKAGNLCHGGLQMGISHLHIPLPSVSCPHLGRGAPHPGVDTRLKWQRSRLPCPVMGASFCSDLGIAPRNPHPFGIPAEGCFLIINNVFYVFIFIHLIA